MLTTEQILIEIDATIDGVIKAPPLYGEEGAAEAIIYQMLALKHQIMHPICQESCPHNAYSNLVHNAFHNALILTANVRQQEPDNFQNRQMLLSYYLRLLVDYANTRHPIRSIMVLENGNVWIDGNLVSGSNQDYELRELLEISGHEAEDLKKELPL